MIFAFDNNFARFNFELKWIHIECEKSLLFVTEFVKVTLS